MWWIFTSMFWLIRSLILELIFFILVDVVAKTPLREAANDAEKRTIWLYEAGVLLGICGVIHWADHTPYVLLGLAVATVLYTQLCSRVDLHGCWASVRTRWDEYQQHEESMRQVQAHLARQQAAAANAVPQSSMGGTSPGRYPVLAPSSPAPVPPHMMPAQGYPPNVTLLGREIPGGPAPNAAGPVFRGAHGGLLWSNLSQSNNSSSGGYFTQPSPGNSSAASSSGYGRYSNQNPTQAYLGQPVSQPQSQSCAAAAAAAAAKKSSGGDSLAARWFGGDLKRKPLRPTDGRVLSPSLGLVASSSASAIKNKLMSALGLGGPQKKPPGLRNKGQNQCFMNCVLQCLARSPYLPQCLAVDAAKELEGTVSESLFLSTLSELLDLLTAEPETLDLNVLDPTAFRHATSSLNRSLVAPVGQPQGQQDAAEFLMWLLDSLHTVLNKNRQALSCEGGESNIGEDRFTSPRLATLRFIYKDLTPAKAKELKDVCMREIELADGLENESYAESIQRLSDLEWLLHKQGHDSVVDALFTGQLVEASLHASPHNRLSVALQTFNVLPVPLAAPRPVSGLVLLEDCFTAFCHIEHLATPGPPPSSTSSSSSSSARDREHHLGKAGVETRRFLTPGGHAASSSSSSSPLSRLASAVSPIVGQSTFVNDSGFSDVFKTSTPIRDGGGGRLGPLSGDVQRRCLLRQLPECLTIQLMRFQYSVARGRPAKLRAPVSVRLKGLDLRALVYDTVTQREDPAGPSHLYDLYGLCLHLGADSTHHGHYVAYCQASASGAAGDDDCWYRFDDESVTEVNMEYELTTKEVRQNAYLLFYKRAAAS